MSVRNKVFHPTVMFLAFANAQVKKVTPLVSRVVDSMARYSKAHKGTSKDKGWDANLSYKTYRHLAAKGVLQ